MIQIQQTANLLRNCRKLVVLTGAGVSKESGVPTFRDAMDGLWAQFDPAQLATPEAFQAHPKRVWDWYEYRRSLVRQARPNPGHFALAELERRVPDFTLVTQNVDDLHEQAGNQRILHLHGKIAQNKCFFNCQGDPTFIDLDQTQCTWIDGVPACPYCGRWVRPDVVWFGEVLPLDILHEAAEASRHCDLMLVIGTAGLVDPAGSLPRVAKQAGAQVIEINPDHSAITRYADIKIDGPSGEVMPAVIEALDHAR